MVTTLVDVIKSVATICNFTLEIHLREDQLSGKINEFTNGSLSYTGVFENLMDTKGTYYLYQKESYELQSRIFLTFLVFSVHLRSFSYSFHSWAKFNIILVRRLGRKFYCFMTKFQGSGFSFQSLNQNIKVVVFLSNCWFQKFKVCSGFSFEVFEFNFPR